MILASAHAYDHSVDRYDPDIERAKQDRLSGASLDGLVSIAYWIGHRRSASGHAPSARWPAPLSRSLLVCSSNACLTGPRHRPEVAALKQRVVLPAKGDTSPGSVGQRFRPATTFGHSAWTPRLSG
jgi:hypothetical protein